ncbi:MAG: hypothetical protein ABIP63_10230 [Thermoanaerobaculia bacterium]
MSTVRVQFSGVVALGPGRPKDEKTPYEQKGPFHAIFPGSSRRACSHEDARVVGYIPVHWPVIMTDAVPETAGRACDDEEGTLRVWYPMRERLIFEIDGKSKPRTLTYQHTDVKPLPDGDVDLLADMRDIWKAKSKVPSKAVGMKENPKKVPMEVAGQVFIPGGHVSSSLGAKKERTHVIFQPPRDLPACECDLVSDAVITFTARKTVKILSRSLDTGEELDSIIFPVKGDLSFHIANADPRDIRHQIANGPRSEPERVRTKADADFELFYSVLAPKEHKTLPVPVDQSKIRLIRDCYVVMTER